MLEELNDLDGTIGNKDAKKVKVDNNRSSLPNGFGTAKDKPVESCTNKAFLIPESDSSDEEDAVSVHATNSIIGQK